MRLLYFLVLSGFAMAVWQTSGTAQAEPWISNRYAQNCAGCHAPGRKNLAPVLRRCTLACQGCHVNPNGGGLRSHYGKWNEDRWLRSFRADLFAHAKSIAPSKKQRYGYGKKWKKLAKKNPRIIKNGYPLKEIPGTLMNEPIYDRRDGLEKVMAETRDEFEFQVPQDDPYRQMWDSKWDAGADIRWQFQSRNIKSADDEGNKEDDKDWVNFLMTGDLSVRWRPIYKKVHFVYEGRYTGQPDFNQQGDGKNPADAFDTLKKRSLYMMVDDLPYNLYVMGGYYRPLFGNFNVDHTVLPQRMISYTLQDNFRSYDLNYQAFTLGGSPNVPYANLHLVQRQFGPSKNETNNGFAANVGGRFVTLGFSVAYSYWRTEKEKLQADEKVTERVEMHHAGIGAQVGPVTVNLDLYSMTKDTPNDAFREGGVYGVETYTRVWRENYLQLAYYSANVAETLDPGAGQQARLGLRSFLYPGVDLYMGFRLLESQKVFNPADNSQQSETNIGGYLGQIHLYM